jgi:5-hydroxyisourate hydrolase
LSSPITTHVLDLARGQPASGIAVVLERQDRPGHYVKIGEGVTDSDGRNRALLAAGALTPGDYRLTFGVQAYFKAHDEAAFYKTIPIEFTVEKATQHYHVPLLLSPFGYSTYRGS